MCCGPVSILTDWWWFPFPQLVLALADKINIDILHTLETHPSLGFQNKIYKYLDIVLEGRYLNIKIGLKWSAQSPHSRGPGQVIVGGASGVISAASDTLFSLSHSGRRNLSPLSPRCSLVSLINAICSQDTELQSWEALMTTTHIPSFHSSIAHHGHFRHVQKKRRRAAFWEAWDKRETLLSQQQTVNNSLRML